MRLHAKPNHPTIKKLDRLIKFLQDEKLEISFYSDRIFVKDTAIQEEKDWEITDLSGSFINELPTAKYKLARDHEVEANHTRASLLKPKNMKYEPIENN